MATRSQELAPNRRTLLGRPPFSSDAVVVTLAVGTQTICMSECTSMPAAFGLRMVMTGVCSRDGVPFRWALLGLSDRLRWLMMSATL